MPQVLVAVAPITFGAGGAAALVTASGALTGLGIAVSLGSSLLLSAASQALMGGRPDTPSQHRYLATPSTAPAYRHVYGRCRAVGTPVVIFVRAGYLYACWLLNSRPSALPEISLWLDKREVALSGDPFDFDGPGAVGTVDPFDHEEVHGTVHEIVRVWVGRGDQTAPPAYLLAQAPWAEGEDEELLLPTDAWRGRTVLWGRFHAGVDERRQERWPAYPPLAEVEGDWSLVWDPRDGAQDPDDPATWEWSDNHALCVLDALRSNPIRQWSVGTLHLPSFEQGADICDQTVPLLSGGSEPRYRAAGTITYASGEVEDQINPLVVSGAADLVRIGGRLGYAAGAWRAPTATATDALGPALAYSDLLPEDDLVSELRVSYLSAERGTELADLQPWPIPGALAEDGGVLRPSDLALPHCPSATQAMRVRKIVGLRLRRQRSLTITLPPAAFDLVPGASVTVDLPAPYGAVMDGVYEVASINPWLEPMGESGMAMRLPAQLVGPHSEAIFAWTPATDEEEVYDEPYDGTRQGVQMPGSITATVEDVTSGGATTQRIRFRFDPSPSEGVSGYRWQYREGDDPWTAGGTIDADVRDGDGKVFGLLPFVGGEPMDIRVRTVASAGKSGWRMIEDIQPLAITGGAATAGLGAATFTGVAPASVTATKLRIYRGTTPTFADAVPVGPDLTVTPGAAFSVTAGDGTRANLLTNGDFSGGATGWTVETDWSVGSGVATKVAGAATRHLIQTPTLVAGEVLRLAYRIVAITAGNFRLRCVGATTVDALVQTMAGSYLGSLTVPASPASLRVTATSTTAGSVDDVVAYVETADCLPQGAAYYWAVPVTTGGVEGTPDGPYSLTII